MYQPHTWVHKETITAQLLNHIEQGIAEAGVSDLFTDTLATGDTTVELTDAKIGTANSITVLTETGVAPTAQSVSGNTLTVTFEVQSSDMEVGIEVK